MPCYAIEDLIPVVDPRAYVHPSASLIGDVIIGAHCYVGPNASLRGDFGRIELRDGSNVQDVCVMHSFPGKNCVVEEDGHVGHGAILHGCIVGRNALVGMNAVVMDDAVIAEECLLAANSFVPARFTCPPRSLLIGNPAKVKRELRDDEIAWKSTGTREYQELVRRCHSSLRETTPLTEVQPDRPWFTASQHPPKS